MRSGDLGEVDPGRLRKRVELQSLGTRTRDGYGQPSRTWSTIGTYWAEIRPVKGRELVNANQVKGLVTHTITMRWPGASLAITPAMQFAWRGRVFKVSSVLNVDERNRRLDVAVTEVVEPQ